MILLQLSKINFSLIGKGFSNECGLDPLNLKSTNELLENFSSSWKTQQVVMRCSLYQIKVFL
jgi:hypothetical protein